MLQKVKILKFFLQLYLYGQFAHLKVDPIAPDLSQLHSILVTHVIFCKVAMNN